MKIYNNTKQHIKSENVDRSIRLMSAKTLCLFHRAHLNMSITEALEWLMSDKSSFELKKYCIEHHDPSMFSNPKEQYEWLIKDSLESPKVENN